MTDDQTPARRGTCPVCLRQMRVLNDGTIGPHTTGKPSRHWPYSSPRCSGWGKQPVEVLTAAAAAQPEEPRP